MLKRNLIIIFSVLFLSLHAQKLDKLNESNFIVEFDNKASLEEIESLSFLANGSIFLLEEECKVDRNSNSHCKYKMVFKGKEIKGLRVVSHFYKKTNLTTVIIPRNIPRIGNTNLDCVKLDKKEAMKVAKSLIKEGIIVDAHFSEESRFGAVIFAPENFNFRKAKWVPSYEIDIHVKDPWQMKRITINAISGEKVFIENRLCSFFGPATAITKYHGEKTIETSEAEGGYVLWDQTRGSGISTYNLNTGALFFDEDNFWDNANEAMDEIGGDAHWGSEATFDFYLDELGLNGVDNNGMGIISNVHLNDANAYWDGTSTSYGDGIEGSDFDQPFTYINVIGHEVTHGVTEFSSGLIYAGESGAMNESISDIMGVSVEDYTNPGNVDWLMGEETSSTGQYFRNMSNPKELEMADTYDGEFWDDFSGVHTNSSIGNYWFYLLVMGGSDVNDVGYSYDVAALGWEKARLIAHNTWVNYLTPSSTYSDCASFSLLEVTDLYGACSDEYDIVLEAWTAVNVLSSESILGIEASLRVSCVLPTEVSFSTFGDISDQMWDFGDGNQSTEENPVHIYQENGVYSVSVVGLDCSGEAVSIVEPDFIVIDSMSNLCDTIFMNLDFQEISECSGVVYDDGGPNSNYSTNSFNTLKLANDDVVGYNLSFEYLEIENNYDFMTITAMKDGEVTYYNQFTGFYGEIELELEGQEVELVFISDEIINYSGFKFEFECQTPFLPIADFTSSIVFLCDTVTHFEDLTEGYPETWQWYVGDVLVSTEENPWISFPGDGFFDISLIVCNSFGCDTIVKENYIEVNAQSTSCDTIIMSMEDLFSSKCIGTLVDDGGTSGDYSNDISSSLIVESPDAMEYRVEILELLTEVCCDYLRIYKDNGNGFEFYGTYGGGIVDSLLVIQATRLLFEWESDFSDTYSGFVVNWECVYPSFPEANADGGLLSTCTGDVVLTDESTGIPTTWEWYIGGELVSTEKNLYFTLTNEGTYDVELIVCNDFGCDTLFLENYLVFDPMSEACDEIVITNNPWVTIHRCDGVLKDNGGDENYTDNFFGGITNTNIGVLGYLLDFELFETESAYDALFVYHGNENELELLDQYSGILYGEKVLTTGNSFQIIFSSDVSINLAGFEIRYTCIDNNSDPVINPSFIALGGCSNQVDFNVNTINASNIEWDFGDGETGVGTEISHDYLNPGIYTVTVTAINDNGVVSESFDVEVYFQSVWFVAPETMKVDSNYVLSPESHLENEIAVIDWFQDGELISNTYLFEAEFETVGAHTLTCNIIDVQGCESSYTVDVMVYEPTGINDLALFDQIKVYPIPASDIISIYNVHLLQEDFVLSLVNSVGEEWEIGDFMKGEEKVHVNVEKYPAGIYFVKLRTKDHLICKRMLIMK